MIKDYMRKDLLDFKPYHAPLMAYDIKLDANENPYIHSPYVLERIKSWVDEKDNLTRYPDTDVHDLRKKLGAYHGVSENEIICTVGSDQLIELIIKVFVEPGDGVLVPNPSFSMYGLSTVLNHGKVITYELNDAYDYDYDLILKNYKDHKPKLIFICTPNNPTGNKASIEGMKMVLDYVDCPVIIDEAYEEFDGDSMVSYIHTYSNLIVLKTFSKAYGIAGLRIGYGIASKEMIEVVNIAKPPYNLSAFSQAVASFILEDIDYYNALVDRIKKEKEKLYQFFLSMSCFERVYPSKANFILVKIKNMDLMTYLQGHRVLIRGFGDTGRLAYHMRVTIGTEDENRRLMALIKTYEL
ncbi:histidinol-phosphate transaminase [Petrocella sp. FN5]|uniref:histidinol-phosphate transaminase n=1 Tax=Petrocella sp. FN5 TaxID=3032002 RepID=UPI0023DC8168|nr:histidinol-phosphate transaminase [Petrocella sp. FN5]MDF1616346.1 histidinol-phosphate transaminase [Petrocella sp. FN5]